MYKNSALFQIEQGAVIISIDLNHTILKSVDNGRLSITAFLRNTDVIIAVYVSVQEQLGAVFVHQSDKTLKSSVRQVIKIIEISCGSMGYQNIKPLMSDD